MHDRVCEFMRVFRGNTAVAAETPVSSPTKLAYLAFMVAHRTHFSAWQDETFACTCGWSGKPAAMGTELFNALAEYSCPQCHAHLILVSYPTGEEIKEAAARGNEKARAMLGNVLDREARTVEWKRDALRDPSQLPDIAGGALAFIWDLEDGLPADNFYVITVGDQLVWRERAFYEDWERFHEIKTILKKKYGDEFKSLTATAAARGNLLGDSVSAELDPT